jgi:hypothetical protein
MGSEELGRAVGERIQERLAHRRRSTPNHPLQLPRPALCFYREVREGEEPVREVLVDVVSDEGIKRDPAVGDALNLLARESGEDESVSNVDTELVATPPASGVAAKTVAQTARAANRVSVEQDRLGGASGQPHVDELVIPPDGVEANRHSRHVGVRPVCETVQWSTLQSGERV